MQLDQQTFITHLLLPLLCLHDPIQSLQDEPVFLSHNITDKRDSMAYSLTGSNDTKKDAVTFQITDAKEPGFNLQNFRIKSADESSYSASEVISHFIESPKHRPFKDAIESDLLELTSENFEDDSLELENLSIEQTQRGDLILFGNESPLFGNEPLSFTTPSTNTEFSLSLHDRLSDSNRRHEADRLTFSDIENQHSNFNLEKYHTGSNKRKTHYQPPFTIRQAPLKSKTTIYKHSYSYQPSGDLIFSPTYEDAQIGRNSDSYSYFGNLDFNKKNVLQNKYPNIEKVEDTSYGFEKNPSPQYEIPKNPYGYEYEEPKKKDEFTDLLRINDNITVPDSSEVPEKERDSPGTLDQTALGSFSGNAIILKKNTDETLTTEINLEKRLEPNVTMNKVINTIEEFGVNLPIQSKVSEIKSENNIEKQLEINTNIESQLQAEKTAEKPLNVQAASENLKSVQIKKPTNSNESLKEEKDSNGKLGKQLRLQETSLVQLKSDGNIDKLHVKSEGNGEKQLKSIQKQLKVAQELKLNSAEIFERQLKSHTFSENQIKELILIRNQLELLETSIRNQSGPQETLIKNQTEPQEPVNINGNKFNPMRSLIKKQPEPEEISIINKSDTKDTLMRNQSIPSKTLIGNELELQESLNVNGNHSNPIRSLIKKQTEPKETSTKKQSELQEALIRNQSEPQEFLIRKLSEPQVTLSKLGKSLSDSIIEMESDERQTKEILLESIISKILEYDKISDKKIISKNNLGKQIESQNKFSGKPESDHKIETLIKPFENFPLSTNSESVSNSTNNTSISDSILNTDKPEETVQKLGIPLNSVKRMPTTESFLQMPIDEEKLLIGETAPATGIPLPNLLFSRLVGNLPIQKLPIDATSETSNAELLDKGLFNDDLNNSLSLNLTKVISNDTSTIAKVERGEFGDLGIVNATLNQNSTTGVPLPTHFPVVSIDLSNSGTFPSVTEEKSSGLPESESSEEMGFQLLFSPLILEAKDDFSSDLQLTVTSNNNLTLELDSTDHDSISEEEFTKILESKLQLNSEFLNSSSSADVNVDDVDLFITALNKEAINTASGGDLKDQGGTQNEVHEHKIIQNDDLARLPTILESAFHKFTELDSNEESVLSSSKLRDNIKDSKKAEHFRAFLQSLPMPLLKNISDNLRIVSQASNDNLNTSKNIITKPNLKQSRVASVSLDEIIPTLSRVNVLESNRKEQDSQESQNSPVSKIVFIPQLEPSSPEKNPTVELPNLTSSSATRFSSAGSLLESSEVSRTLPSAERQDYEICGSRTARISVEVTNFVTSTVFEYVPKIITKPVEFFTTVYFQETETKTIIKSSSPEPKTVTVTKTVDYTSEIVNHHTVEIVSTDNSIHVITHTHFKLNTKILTDTVTSTIDDVTFTSSVNIEIFRPKTVFRTNYRTSNILNMETVKEFVTVTILQPSPVYFTETAIIQQTSIITVTETATPLLRQSNFEQLHDPITFIVDPEPTTVTEIIESTVTFTQYSSVCEYQFPTSYPLPRSPFSLGRQIFERSVPNYTTSSISHTENSPILLDPKAVSNVPHLYDTTVENFESTRLQPTNPSENKETKVALRETDTMKHIDKNNGFLFNTRYMVYGKPFYRYADT